MVTKSKKKGTSWERDFVELVKVSIPATRKVKRIAGSGAIGTTLDEPLLMGDIMIDFPGFPRKFRAEAKVGYGGDTQLTVKRDWLNKIKEEADSNYAYPLTVCKFSGAKKSGGVQYFVIFDFDTFSSIINYVNDLKRELDLLYEKIERNA